MVTLGKKGNTWINGSRLGKSVTLGKIAHTWKNGHSWKAGSNLEKKGVTLGKRIILEKMGLT